MNVDFLSGFVKRCMDNGLTADQTEALFGQYVNTALLSNPEIRKGASAVLDDNQGRFRKAAFAAAMEPELLSQIIERVVHEGESLGAQELRRYHPEHIKLAQTFAKQASYIHETDTPQTRSAVSEFERMPLSQKLTIISALGGGIGAASNVISPEPQELLDGKLKQGLHGAVRGAAIGAGGLLGAQVGKDLASQFSGSGPTIGPRDQHWVAQIAGGVAGGMGGKAVADRVLQP